MRDKSKVKFGILTFAILLTILAFVGCGSAKTWYVDDNGGCDFTRIQDAIDAALPSDTIFVYNGTYYKKIKINKDNLTIIGEDKNGTVINQIAEYKSAIIIDADYVAVNGFTIHSNGDGIELLRASDCIISNNKITSDLSGILIGSGGGANNNLISNNTISMSERGIWACTLGSFLNNAIINNLLLNNHCGLDIEGSNWTIANNYVYGSKTGLSLRFSESILKDNTILNNLEGVKLGFGHNNIVQNNTISNNRGNGLWLGYTYNPSNNNQIRNNKIMNNEEDGIHSTYSYASNNIIEDNIVNNNGDDGIDIRGRNYDNIIENNTILDNINFDIITYGTKTNIFNNTARRIHGDLVKNDIINNIYPRPTIASTFTIDSPIIDGRMEDGEWLNKIEIKLNGFSDDDHYDGEENEKLTKTADLYVMNDAENIYIAVVLEDMPEEDEDFLRLEFDQGDDAVHTDGDEDMASLCGLGYNDCHWNVDRWQADTNYHGEMVRRWSVADRKYVYEFRKPLNSSDPQDINLKAGDTVGFHIVAFDYYSGIGYRYPMDAVSFDAYHSKDEDIIFTPPVGEESGAWKKWADLITAEAVGPGVVVSTGKYEYTSGDAMLINITLANPTEVWQPVYFLWRLDLPDYDLQYWITKKPIYLPLPPDYEQTFTVPWKLGSYGFSFNASWYIAIYDATSHKL